MPKKLLVADDSLTIQKVIRLALSGAASSSGDGYDIQAVSDGNDAIQQISLFRPDIVLIDVSLPGKSAFEVKRATNQHRDLESVRFVLMSSAFEKVDEPQVTEVGFHGRLTKPFDPAHLREVLSQVLASAPMPSTPPPLPPDASSEFESEQEERTLTDFNAPPSGFPSFGEPSVDEDESTAPLTPPDAEEDSLPPPLPSFEDEPTLASRSPKLPPEAFDAPPPFPGDSDGMPGLPRMPEIPVSEEPEGDIRSLTESTLRMSGLAELDSDSMPVDETPPTPPEPEETSEFTDDFQWSIQEHSLKAAPGVDAGNSTFPLAPPPDLPDEHSRFIEQPPRPSGPEPWPSHELELTPPPAPGSSFDEPLIASPVSDEKPQAPRPSTASSKANAVAAGNPTPTQPAPAVDMSQLERKMEEMIRREVESAIRKITQKTLPEVAERLLKEEIRKLLNELP